MMSIKGKFMINKFKVDKTLAIIVKEIKKHYVK